MNVLGVICARYHSEGLPGKNWREMHGKPLIEHAIEKAYATQTVDEVLVCTDIPRSVWSYAVPRLDRPDELTGPDVSKYDVWRWIAQQKPADIIVDIDVTRPLTLAADIDGCVAKLARAAEFGLDGAMAVAEATKLPAFDFVLNEPWCVRPYVRDVDYSARQQVPNYAYYHGGIYALTHDALLAHTGMWDVFWKGYEIPTVRSYDIDTEIDWKIVDMLMAEQMHVVS